ncbi:MAG TPA: MMPL family transporter [Candidatus Saccharimonadales bacterium]|nr:MMPL family transporter [Candidatus Saccharimonadales bacterium]
MIKKIALISYKYRLTVVIIWLCLLGGAAVWAHFAGNGFATNFRLNGTDSQAASDLLSSRFPSEAGSTGDIVFKASGGIYAPQTRQEIQTLLSRVSNVSQVSSIESPYGQQNLDQVSLNGEIAYAVVQFNSSLTAVTDQTINSIQTLSDQASNPNLEIELGSGVFSNFRPQLTSEAIGITAAIIILLIVFGSIIAAGLPIFNALVGIGIGVSLVELLAHLIALPSFSTQLGAMLGIGVGIDYTLLIVTRYRQGLSRNLDPKAAVLAAMDTAGRSVLFAGIAVVISLLGMLISGVNFIQGLGIASAVVVCITMLASITLLPAVLSFIGRKIDHLKLRKIIDKPSDSERYWYRWSIFIQKRPIRVLVIGFAILVILAIPLLSIRLGSSDSSNQPTSSTNRRAYDLISEGFGVGTNGPLLIAAAINQPNPLYRTYLHALTESLRATPGVASVSPAQINRSADAAIIQVIPTTSPEAVQTTDLINQIRDSVIPNTTNGTGITVHVGGVTATYSDLSNLLQKRLAIFISAVLGLSFILLLLVFRSVVIPIKAVVMNIFSIGAAYGVLVAVFQWGWLKSIVGIGQGGPIDSYVPMIMFAVLFGLSMDYEVFLISRIKEEYGLTSNNSQAVARGLTHTARVISAAALIMVTVFASFVITDFRILKEFGLGLAVAILIDATVVRLAMVPAAMEILGKANWWLPRWLEWLPKVRIGRD